jgi:hypothetical protein
MSRGKGARTHDPRFSAWHQQPRAHRLTKRIRGVAQADDAFAQALKQRTEPERVDALLNGRGRYWSATPCAQCGGAHRRVYDRACWTCWQTKHRPTEQWDAIRAGKGYRAGNRSREGYLMHLQWVREQKAAGVVRFERGPWVALRHPDQRTELRNTESGACIADLKGAYDMNPRQWHTAIETDANLFNLVTADLGW